MLDALGASQARVVYIALCVMASKEGVTAGKPKAKMGTAHRYWQVADSGYAKFAMKNEDKTRVSFLHGRYSLERSPNPILAETADCTKGWYLVKMPTDAALARKREEAELASTNAALEQENLALQLNIKTKNDLLQKEHARLSRELRELGVTVSTNSFQRERALLSWEIEPVTHNPKRCGVKHTLQHFPSLRSKPRFTAYIKNDKGL